jgi:acyl-CoA dehydrogenase
MRPAESRPDFNTLDEVLGEVRAHADRLDETAGFPLEALESLRKGGWLGLLAPIRYGGLGGRVQDVLTVAQRLAREDLSVGLIFVMHSQQLAALAHCASGPAARDLLAHVVGNRQYVASVTTAPTTGSNLLTADSDLTVDNDRLVIDRVAPIVTGVEHADGFLIATRAPQALSETEVCMVYADRQDLDVAVTGDWQPLGMRACRSPGARLRGSVPRTHVLAERQAHRRLITQLFAPMAHLSWSACWLGAAAGAFERTVRYLRSRDGRSRHDVTGELLLSRLGRVRGRLEMVNAHLHHAADVFERYPDQLGSAPAQSMFNALKVTAAEQCSAAVDELVDIVGLKAGYFRGSPVQLERSVRDLRAASLTYSNDRLLVATGRLALLDREVRLA